MHARNLALTLGLLALVGAGCANARLRAERRALPPPTEETPQKKEARPVWFGLEGKTDGRPSKKAGWTQAPKADAPVVRERPPGRKRYPNDESPLGTNLASVGPDSRDWVFVDVFRMASPWVLESDRPADAKRAPEQDANGWVQALAAGQVAVTRLPTHAGGRFVVLYKGRGDIELRGARVVEDRPGRMIYEAPARRTISLVLRSTNSGNYVRDIRVVPADFEATYAEQIFHPLFLQRLARFSVLRFSGWARAAKAAAPTWGQRVTPAWYTQGGPRGVAFEYMVMLANELGVDLWLSVPHHANDDFVIKLATFLEDRLDPDLKVYLEYGTAFDQEGSDPARYATTQGQFMGLDANPARARMKFRVRRSVDVFSRFATRFPVNRTFKVITGPVNDADGLRELLDYKSVSKKVDLVAVAPFVGVRVEDASRAQALAGMKAGELLDALEFTSLPAVMSQVRAAQRVAAEFGVGLVSYSGGADLTVKPGLPQRDKLDALFDEVSKSPRAGGLYSAMLSGWADSGGELFVHAPLVAPHTKQGRTAALEYQDQGAQQAPRYIALMTFAENRDRWWGKRRPDTKPKAATEVAEAPAGPATEVDKAEAPSSQENLIWATGGAGIAAAASGAIFTGLYFKSVAARDRFLADEPFQVDGARGRELDDQAFNYSLALTTSFGLAAVGFGSAAVLDLFEEVGYDGVNPGVVIGASTGVVALIASSTFLVAYLNTLSERDERLQASPTPDEVQAFALRNLDDEAFRWSLASAGALGVSVASFALALTYYLVDDRDPYRDQYFTDPAPEEPATSGVEVLPAPNGLMVRW